MAWGQTPASYLLPSVKLTVAGTGWLTGAAVSSWTLERELVASTIPGNIRQRNGLSIGAASVSVKPAVRVTPWSTAPTTRVATGLPATLVASDGSGVDLPLGSWVTDDTDGALSSGEVSIDLLEAQYAGGRKPQALEPYWGPIFGQGTRVDPVWVIGRLLEQVGFPAVPPTVPSTILAAPLNGTVGPVRTSRYPLTPYLSAGQHINGFQVLDGDVAVGLGSDTFTIFSTNTSLGRPTVITDVLRTGASVFLTLNAVGEVHVYDASQKFYLRIRNNHDTSTYTIAASNTDLAPTAAGATFAGKQSPAWTNRVQVEIQRTPSADGSQWVSTRARARSGPTATWSAWSTDSASASTPISAGLELLTFVTGTVVSVGTPPGQYAAIQFTTEADPNLWVPSRASLKPLGVDMGIPMVPPELDNWSAIQDLCSANLAATIIDSSGIARVLTRDDIAGVGIPGEVTDIGAEWADLNWTLDPDDSADRVVVTYLPPSLALTAIGNAEWAPEVWRASEVIAVPPGQTSTIPVTFENRAAIEVFGVFVVPSAPDPIWSQTSTIVAFDNPDGTGTVLPTTAFRASARQLSPTTAEIKVQNLTGAPLYLVDGNGDPCLILRADTVASYETPQVVERGASASEAQRPLEVDLSTWVQSENVARYIADYLWSRVSGAGLWKASSVQCRLDWRHDIGRILRAQHPATGLDAKVLTAKVHLEGEAGEISQSLDLVLLPPTWADFDSRWLGKTWANFDTAWSTKTWDDFDANPLWNGA